MGIDANHIDTKVQKAFEESWIAHMIVSSAKVIQPALGPHKRRHSGVGLFNAYLINLTGIKTWQAKLLTYHIQGHLKHCAEQTMCIMLSQ